MGFFKSPAFKYIKNLLIGVGAAVVMIGALGKINSEFGLDVKIILLFLGWDPSSESRRGSFFL